MRTASSDLSEIDQYALQNIRCRVHELVACQLFREDDRQDLEQQLFLEYWKRIGGFKRERGTYKTFINRLIRNRTASLALKAIRSGVGKIASLTDDDESECPIEASAGLDDASRSSTAEAIQARIDVEKVLSSVDARVQILAQEIRTEDFGELAAKMGTKLGLTSRRTYQFREQLRAAFRTNGLAPAWQGAR
jgi:DNA-directed RNA polymerase specialized sigma24 family protein